MITIKPLDKPKLGNIKMSCDKVIHKKLTLFPMINDTWSTNNFTVIVGRMGQGKTSLLTLSLIHISEPTRPY